MVRGYQITIRINSSYLGLSIIHNATHDTYFAYVFLNKLFLHTYNQSVRTTTLWGIIITNTKWMETKSQNT